MFDSDTMDEMLRIANEAKDTPELRFHQTPHVPVGSMYRIAEVERDSKGQAFLRVLLNPADAPVVRAAIRPLLHPLLGRMPPGLE
jgi:hypothetical protein